MSIATEITALNTNLAAAKNAVTAKGGTVGDTGLAGLATEIANIPSGGGSSIDYGTVTWYDWSATVNSTEGNACEVEVTDATALAAFLMQGGFNPIDNMVDFQYDSNTQTFYTWSPSGGEFRATVSKFAQNGLLISNIEPENSPFFSVEFGSVVLDKTSNNSYTIVPLEYKQLFFNGSTECIALGLEYVPKGAIAGFTFGTDFAETSIGDYFLSGCTSFNCELIIPNTITSIGNYFLQNCTSFNYELTIPNTVTSIGTAFLSGCKSFNSPVTLSNNITSISSYFMYGCNSMTNTVNVGTLPATVIPSNQYSFSTGTSSADCYLFGIVIIGTYAADWITRLPDRSSSPYRKLIGGSATVPTNSLVKTDGTVISLTANDVPSLCTSTSTITLNGTTISKSDVYGVDISNTGVTVISDYFLYACLNMRVLRLPMTVQTIGSEFLLGCSSFNDELVLPTNLTMIGNEFMRSCGNFNQPITLPSTLASIGQGFLNDVIKMSSTIYINSNAIPSVGSPDSLTTSFATYPAYAIGITLSGDNAQAWKTRFPDSSSGNYRKLLIAQ